MPLAERLGDRRAELRVEIIGDLRCALVMTRSWPLRNLGVGGMLVECSDPLIVGSIHHLRLCLDDGTWDVTAAVRHVTRIRDQPKLYAVGLAFVNLSAVTHDEIVAFHARNGAVVGW